MRANSDEDYNMLGAYIAITALVVVWGVLLTRIIRATNFRQLRKSLQYDRQAIEKQEKVHYRKKGWTDRHE